MPSTSRTHLRTLDDVEVADKRVLVRVDFNVPLDDDGRITDDTRIRATLPTIRELQDKNARIILVTHLGRPKDREPELSLRPVAERLGELLGVKVELAPCVVGEEVEELAAKLRPSEILMLENVRYEPGETKNDRALAEQLARLADVYINDAFGAAHRAHASTEGVAHHVEVSAAGRLLEREIKILGQLLEDPQRPLVAVLGGSKVTDKIGVIDTFLKTADKILIGGAMCFPFFAAQGHGVGASLCEAEGIGVAKELLERGSDKLMLPVDLVAGEGFSADSPRHEISSVDVPDGLMGLDVGIQTTTIYAREIEAAGTVFVNGTMGAFELPPFAAGSKAVAQAVANSSAISIIGGGDTVAAFNEFGLADRIHHISTGGGAALEFLEGAALPGVEVLS